MRLWSGISAIGGGALVTLLGWAFVGRGPGVVVLLGPSEFFVTEADDPRVQEGVRLAAARALRREVYLRVPDGVVALSAKELGLVVDETETLRQVSGLVDEALVPSRSFGRRLSERFRDEPKLVRQNLVLAFDERTATGAIERLAKEVDREAVDAEVRIVEHRIAPSLIGQLLHRESTVLRVERALRAGDGLVDADVEALLPDVTEEEVSPVDVSLVLASFETSFRGKAGSRKVNIARAARYLDGAIIAPGEVLSFNQRVGRRVHGRGFVDAPVILNDELEQDVGGGVCQVATTLHAAAIYGNLEVVERRSHSRPSGYAPLGLDATVIDGKVDLRLRNPYDEPLLVHAFLSGPFTVKVEILGHKADVQVEHAYSVSAKESFARRVWVKEEVPALAFERKQKGSPGMDVVSVVRVKRADGQVERHSYSSKYYPVPEVFWVGRGVSAAELPSLPEGATALLFDGSEVPLPSAAQRYSPTDVPTLDEADGLSRRQ